MLQAGHDPDRLLDYSFDQLALFARCVLGHQVRMLEMVLEPALAAAGVEYKPAQVAQPQAAQPPVDLEAKEAAQLRAMAASPFAFKTVKTSGEGGDGSIG